MVTLCRVSYNFTLDQKVGSYMVFLNIFVPHVNDGHGIGNNITFLTFLRLPMIQRKTRQDFTRPKNLGQRTIKDIEDKREAKLFSLEDWTLSRSTGRNREKRVTDSPRLLMNVTNCRYGRTY